MTITILLKSRYLFPLLYYSISLKQKVTQTTDQIKKETATISFLYDMYCAY
ncbi:hypothetical protein LPICM02_50006 [Pseudolactococcus piscium]|nr:hypothetical protein LPICM02_50006 [Lactococcus piscium]